MADLSERKQRSLINKAEHAAARKAWLESARLARRHARRPVGMPTGMPAGPLLPSAILTTEDSKVVVVEGKDWTKPGAYAIEEGNVGLDKRPVETKAVFSARQRQRKAEHRAERGLAVRERVAPVDNGEKIKAEIIDKIRNSGHPKAEGFLEEFGGHHPKAFANGKIEMIWADRTKDDEVNDAILSTFGELGARPSFEEIMRWTERGLQSAQLIGLAYAGTKGDPRWKGVKAIVAKLGTCAFLAHIAHVDGDTVTVLGDEDKLPTAGWVSSVGGNLSRITGRKIMAVASTVPIVWVEERTAK